MPKPTSGYVRSPIERIAAQRGVAHAGTVLSYSAHMPGELETYDAVAARFTASRAQRDALIAQAQSWTGVAGNETLSNFDSVTPLDGGQLGTVYARLLALSIQRLRVLSAQLEIAYAASGPAAFVREKLIYNPGTQEVEVAGEEPTVLAKMEAEERDRLEELISKAVRLKMEVHAQQAVSLHGRRMATLAQKLCEAMGYDWGDADTKRLAQSAVLAAEAEVSRGG